MRLILNRTEEGIVIDSNGKVTELYLSEDIDKNSTILIDGVRMEVLRARINPEDETLVADVYHPDYCYRCGAKIDNIRVQSITGLAYCSLGCGQHD